MLDLKKYLLLFSLTIGTPNLLAETTDDPVADLMGTVWQLIKNGSQSSSFGSGQVVYFLSSDAHNTHRSRKFQTWDTFSMVDGRNLVRLKKNESIEIIMPKFNNSIYEVKLLDGFYKGKTYYLIADELEKNFKQEIEDNDSI
ncbi:MAG: hypothetical protein CMA22_06540 [Euryarchaeota archaeon]|nr:hypothetical protein [Euryarchaeota archaeon]|tara:strand:- start:10 stop:435 length:426 start_codon:yes stop_codon:yes gene_type:complete